MADDQEGDAPAPLTPEQNALAVSHLHLVEEQARQLRHGFPQIDLEELISFGYLGLLRAAKNYKPEIGPFPNFAGFRIRGQIIDEVRNLSRYSERQQDIRKEVRKKEELLARKRAMQQELSKTAEELIDFLGKNPMPQYVGSEAAATVKNAEPSPETAVHYARIRERVRQAARDLGTDERNLVSRIYFRNMNLQDAADDLGLNKSWASRLHARALRFLQTTFRRDDG